MNWYKHYKSGCVKSTDIGFTCGPFNHQFYKFYVLIYKITNNLMIRKLYQWFFLIWLRQSTSNPFSLLMKLIFYVIKESSIEIIKSYFINRSQFVSVRGNNPFVTVEMLGRWLSRDDRAWFRKLEVADPKLGCSGLVVNFTQWTGDTKKDCLTLTLKLHSLI